MHLTERHNIYLTRHRFYQLLISIAALVGLGTLFFRYYRNRTKMVDSSNDTSTTDDICPNDAGPSGLKNIGEFCYMNSMVQALASANIFITQMNNIPENPISKGLLDLLERLNHSRSNVDMSTEQLNALMDNVRWEKTSQQDAFDLLSTIINRIHENIKKKDRQIRMPLKIRLLHTFNGTSFVNKVQDHLGLSLGLFGDYSEPTGVDLEELIKKHFTSTSIDDDLDKTTQMFFYKDVPEVLLLHIQANKWDEIRGEMYKPTYRINYGKDLSLDMDIAMDETNDNIRHMCGIKYQLSAIVQHFGNIYGGHYITYRKWEGSWYLVNDLQVTKAELHKDVCPYIMVYEKTSSHEI